MSYYNQQPGQGYPPPQGHSPVPPPGQAYGQPPNQYPPSPAQYPPPQQGWSQPPPMQNQQYPPPQGYPPQQYPPPQQGQYGQPPPPNQYGAPPSQPPPNQYGAPPGPPPPGQYGAPPGQPQYGAPPPGQPPYGAPPPGQYPPQQQWGQQPPPGPYGPPQGQPQYGAPPPGQYPPQQQQGYPPPQQQQYGAPPPGPHGAYPSQPTPPSPGYGPSPPGVMVTPQIEGLYKAMKGFGTNEKQLISILSKADAIQINVIREQYQARYHTDLIKHLESEASGDFEAALVHVARGPLLGDCHALKAAMKGVGTNEDVLTDVLSNRSNADINAIKTEYQRMFGTTLEADLRSDLSANTQDMFLMIAAAKRHEDSDPVIQTNIDADVKNLQDALGNFVMKNGVKISEIITSRNDAQLRAIAQTYEHRYGRSLPTTIDKAFSGHMQDTLLLFIARAQNRALSDAIQLEDSMKGLGTKDTLLIQRTVRAHWNRQHMQQVCREYKTKYGKDLVRRIKGETRGDYEKFLVALVEG